MVNSTGQTTAGHSAHIVISVMFSTQYIYKLKMVRNDMASWMPVENHVPKLNYQQDQHAFNASHFHKHIQSYTHLWSCAQVLGVCTSNALCIHHSSQLHEEPLSTPHLYMQFSVAYPVATTAKAFLALSQKAKRSTISKFTWEMIQHVCGQSLKEHSTKHISNAYWGMYACTYVTTAQLPRSPPLL